MNNQLLQIKVEQRLNKLSSQDYGNIQCWMILEAFNKAQSAWVRRQFQGINQTKTGNEGSTRRIDDLQVILKDFPLTMSKKADGLYWESQFRPEDYMDWCRISAKAWNECCPARPLVIYEGNEADRDVYLADTNRQPNYDWAFTFSTCIDNTFRIYTNSQFDIQEPVLTYYRQPREVVFKDCMNLITKVISTIDVECEFADNIIELIVEDAGGILAADLDNYVKAGYLTANSEKNN